MECIGIRDVSGLGRCGSLNILDLSFRLGINDVSGLEHCESSTPSSDVSGLGQCRSTPSTCHNINDVSGLGQCRSLHTLVRKVCHSADGPSWLGSAVPSTPSAALAQLTC
eukprot:TRINITY_DN15774_c0_g1_i2.p1 TRINITY_DN15774_c0_g1~~TRINITY_DN15774_c0_g1_i2.p1  ORF type:complete len:110 (-),score=13.14 TRINITY_DN15774_c0_g1_i2:296-625(-)